MYDRYDITQIITLLLEHTLQDNKSATRSFYFLFACIHRTYGIGSPCVLQVGSVLGVLPTYSYVSMILFALND